MPWEINRSEDTYTAVGLRSNLLERLEGRAIPFLCGISGIDVRRRCFFNKACGKLPPHGEVAEWSKAHAWKVCIRQRIEGSNPSFSATFEFKQF